MVSQLPLPVSCIALAHILDDRDAVEGYISQDPDTANCFPVILRDFMNTEMEKLYYGEPDAPIPNADTTRRYLLALWSDGDRIVNAGKFGASPLVSYFNDKAIEEESSDIATNVSELSEKRYSNLNGALFYAATNGHTDTIALLQELGATDPGNGSLRAAIGHGHIDTALQLTNEDNVFHAMNTAMPLGNLSFIQTLAKTAEDQLNTRNILELVESARDAGKYDIASWLAGYH